MFRDINIPRYGEVNQNNFRANRQIHFEMPLESIGLTSTCELKKGTTSIYLNSAFPENSVIFLAHVFIHSVSFLICFVSSTLHKRKSSQDTFYSMPKLFEKSLLVIPLIWAQLSRIWDGLAVSVESEECEKISGLFFSKQNQLAWYQTQWSWNGHPTFMTEPIK